MKFWQADSFTNKPFQGNPAAVFVLDKPISDELMQNIAIEMNLSETAFILRREGENPLLRWFTPTFEIDLCGHATLASAHIYSNVIRPGLRQITFDTKFAGALRVVRNGNSYTMDFPSRLGEKIDLDAIPNFVFEALSEERPLEAYSSRDLMLVYGDEKDILRMTPDFNALLKYKKFIIVTAKSRGKYDFISRFFCADDGIAEDPVTGSAHCTLAPYWAKRMGRTHLRAYQASKRGGELILNLMRDRVHITGRVVSIIEGVMTVEGLENASDN